MSLWSKAAIELEVRRVHAWDPHIVTTNAVIFMVGWVGWGKKASKGGRKEAWGVVGIG